MSFNPLNAIAQGVLGVIGNVPGFGTALKPLTDALSGLFGGQQGSGNIQSAMNDYSNGSLDGGGLFNAVSNGLDSSAASDNGGPADQLRQFLASQSRSGSDVDGDKLMRLLEALRGGSGNAGSNITTVADTAGSQRAIAY